MRIAALTQGINIPSSRFRIRQLIKPLSDRKVFIDEFFSLLGSYPPEGKLNRIRWLIKTEIDACRRAIATHKYDVCVLQRELISTLPSFEGLARKPIIADVDDAIWMYRHGWAAKNLARHASHVVAGNSYLAEHFTNMRCQVTVIPTGVDTDRFHPQNTSQLPKNFGIIGWSGTWGGYVYFQPIQNALSLLLRKHKNWKIRFISDRPPFFEKLPQNQVEYVPWSPDDEVSQISELDIGLMPLDDTEWSLGKCSYKMLLYMACAVPVVATDIGMNQDILRMDDVGLGAHTPDDWQAALETLMEDPALRQRMGRSGLQLVEQRFSLDVVASQWLDVLAKFK